MQSMLITTNDADNDHSQQTVVQYKRMLIVFYATGTKHYININSIGY